MDHATSAERDAILAYEAQLMIQTYGATPINNSISQMQLEIRLRTGELGKLFVNFGNYPQHPPTFSLSEDIKPFVNLSFSLESLRFWNGQNPPHIKDIVYELIQKLTNPNRPIPQRSEFRSSVPQLSVSLENEILGKLEQSIKNFFRERMNMEVKKQIIYCETKEEYRLLTEEPVFRTPQSRGGLSQTPDISAGRCSSKREIYINKALIREMPFKSIKEYFYEIASVLIHELIGHAYIFENTALGKLITSQITFSLLQAGDPVSLKRLNEIIRTVEKFTDEGWSEWVRWFFDTHYDDPTLHDYVLSKGDRIRSEEDRRRTVYSDLKTFKAYLRAFLAYIQSGEFNYEDLSPLIPYQDLQSKLIRDEISIDSIIDDFKRILHLLDTLLQDLAGFNKENYNTVLNIIPALSHLDDKYAKICPILTYGIGFLILKRIQERYSPAVMSELIKVVLHTRAKPDYYSIKKYYSGKFENWHDVKLALLLLVPVTPQMRIDGKQCRKVVRKHLF